MFPTAKKTPGVLKMASNRRQFNAPIAAQAD
jgi:hypothetical protein